MKRDFVRAYLIGATLLLGIVFLGLLFKSDVNYAYLFGSPSDTFMDYYNSILGGSLVTSYQSGNIYPPLCWIFFDICRLLSGDVRKMYTEAGEKATMLKTFQAPTMVYTIILMFVFLLTYVLISEIWDFEKLKKQWAIFLLMLSIPFLYMIERGNILFLAFVGTLAFFAMKDSEKQWVRNAGYLCLAFAAAIKVYPAIFGFVLLKDKKYKEACKLAAYGIVIFVLQFVFFSREGVGGILLFFRNLMGFNSAYADTIANQLAIESGAVENVKEVIDANVIDGGRIGFAAFMEKLFMWLGVPIGSATQMAAKLGGILSILAFIMAFFSKKNWQTILLLSCVLAGFQSRSYVYTVVFLIIPFLFFLKEESVNGWNVIYFILMMLILFPLPFGWTEHLKEWSYYVYHRSFNALQIGGAMWAITIISMVDIGTHLVKVKKRSGKVIGVKRNEKNQHYDPMF